MINLEYFLNFNVDNKPEFIKKFIFNPLFEAYDHLKLIEVIKNSNEVKINREMYKYIRDFSSISKAIKKQIITVNYKPKEVVGDEEHEPDFEFKLPNCFRIFFEAKRIYRPDSYSKYCGEGGLGRFLSGYYSSEYIDGGDDSLCSNRQYIRSPRENNWNGSDNRLHKSKWKYWD